MTSERPKPMVRATGCSAILIAVPVMLAIYVIIYLLVRWS